MPALKLSQPQGSFYVISRKAPVETIESQECLPTPLTFMRTPVIDTAATGYRHTPDLESAIAPDVSARSSVWHCLPLQQLTNFEVIHQQFAAQQVWFESAIALRPSNPAFQVDESSLTLMGYAQAKGLKVTLGDSITEVDFGFISNQPLIISCLDDQGHCLAMLKATTEEATQSEQDSLEPLVQGVTLNTRGARTLRIDACAPFVVTRFWVKQAVA